MPERNLVTCSCFKYADKVLLLTLLGTAVWLTGCSKLSESASNFVLTPPSQQALATQIDDSSGEKALNFIEKKSDFPNSPEARFVGLHETSDPVVKLKARTLHEPPAPSIASATDSNVMSLPNSKVTFGATDSSKAIGTSLASESNTFEGAPIQTMKATSIEQSQGFEPSTSNGFPELAKVDPDTMLKSASDSNTFDAKPNFSKVNALAQQADPLLPLRPQTTSQNKFQTQQASRLEPLKPLVPQNNNTPAEANLSTKTSRPGQPMVLKAKAEKTSTKVIMLEAKTIEPTASGNATTEPKASAMASNTVTGVIQTDRGVLGRINVDAELNAKPTGSSKSVDPQTSFVGEPVTSDIELAPKPATDANRLAPEVKPIDAPAPMKRSQAEATAKKPESMMTVTPVLVIQEEEEEPLGINLSAAPTGNQFEVPPADIEKPKLVNEQTSNSDVAPNQLDSASNKFPEFEIPKQPTNFSPVKKCAGCGVAGCAGCLMSGGAENVRKQAQTENQDTFQIESIDLATEIKAADVREVETDVNSFEPVAETVSLSADDQRDSHAFDSDFQPNPIQPKAESPVTKEPMTQTDPTTAITNELSVENNFVPSETPDAAIEKAIPQTAPTPVSQSHPTPTVSEQLESIIANIETEVVNETNQAARNGLEVNLRLLQLMQRQIEQLDRQGRMINDDQKRSLQHQLDALSTMLVDPRTRASTENSQSLASLEHAVEELRSLAELEVVNAVFCTQINGFGKFKSFATSTFRPNQKMLVYCEVNNQTSVITNNSSGASEHRTRLKGTCLVYDADGTVAQRSEFAPIDDVARNRRKDFYVYFPVKLNNLQPGEYHMTVMIEDIYGSKTATLQQGIFFSVK